MHKTAINRAAIYVKEPALPHPDGADVERQMAEAQEYCEAQGLEVAVRYREKEGSREEFQRMMANATSEERSFDRVVVWKLMYFAQMLEESILARDKLEAHAVKLLSVKERLQGE